MTLRHEHNLYEDLPALGREFERIRSIIQKDLLEPFFVNIHQVSLVRIEGVRVNRKTRHVVINLDILLTGLLLEELDRDAHALNQVNLLAVQLELLVVL